MREQDDAITEGRLLALLDGVVERLLFRIEDASAQWVRSKQAVPSRMPVGREAGVLGLIENPDRDLMLLGVVAGEGTPAPAGCPDCSALHALAGEVNSCGACGVN